MISWYKNGVFSVSTPLLEGFQLFLKVMRPKVKYGTSE